MAPHITRSTASDDECEAGLTIGINVTHANQWSLPSTLPFPHSQSANSVETPADQGGGVPQGEEPLESAESY